MTLSIAFEMLVSLLLVVTIGYCFQLDRRLKALRSGQDGVRESILQLLQATAKAEQSVEALTRTGTTVTTELESRIVEAKILTRKLGAEPQRHRVGRIPKKPVSVSSPLAIDPAKSSLMDRLKQVG